MLITTIDSSSGGHHIQAGHQQQGHFGSSASVAGSFSLHTAATYPSEKTRTAQFMRLQDGQIEAITEVVRQFAGDTSRVFLFGSRTRDGAKGGDVDLLVETVQEMPRLQRARMKMALEAALDLPVDLVVRPESTPPTAFERLARRQAIPLAKEVTAR